MKKQAGPIGDFVNDVKDAFTFKQSSKPKPQQGVKFNPNNQSADDIKKYIQNNYNASRDYYSNELGIDNPKYLHDDSFINALDAAEQKYGKGFMDYYGDDFYDSVENSLSSKQNKQASDVLNEMYMEKQAGIKQTAGRYKDLITGKTLKETEEFARQYPSLTGDLYREVRKAKAKRKKIIKRLVGAGVVGTGAAGAYALKKHHDKKASELLIEMYMQKTAGVTNTPRLCYQENR